MKLPEYFVFVLNQLNLYVSVISILTWWHVISIAAQAQAPEMPCPEACSKKELLKSVEFQPEHRAHWASGVTPGTLVDRTVDVMLS